MFELIIAFILANYAIARTITREDGPFFVFGLLRSYAKRGKPQAPEEPTTPTDSAWSNYNSEFDNYEHYIYWWKRSLRGTIGEVLSCAYCLSYYSAALVVAYWAVSTGIQWYSPVVWFAVVGGSHFLLKIEDK